MPEQIPFEPRYSKLTARERKIKEMYGENAKVNIMVPEAPVEAVSVQPMTPNRRRMLSELIPATQPWSTPAKAILSDEPVKQVPVDVRKEKSELLSATQAWATPQKGPSVTIDNPRRVLNDLVPVTIPWVVPLGVRHDPEVTIDCRRKKWPTEHPNTGIFGSVKTNTSQGTTIPDTIALVTSIYRIENVSRQWNEVALKKLLGKAGLHVVTVIVKTDFFSSNSEGVADVHIRHVKDELGNVNQKLQSTLDQCSMKAVFLK